MILSYSWLVEHLNDDIVILDSRGNVACSYAHIPNSQPLGLEKVVKTNLKRQRTDLLLCSWSYRGANVFGQLKIAGYENVKLYDGSFAHWTGRRLPLA